MTIAPEQARLAKRPGVPLIDGIEKVTGKARYTADLDHADALVGRIFRCPFSHADILRLDVSKARALDGVVAVVSGDDAWDVVQAYVMHVAPDLMDRAYCKAWAYETEILKPQIMLLIVITTVGAMGFGH